MAARRSASGLALSTSRAVSLLIRVICPLRVHTHAMRFNTNGGEQLGSGLPWKCALHRNLLYVSEWRRKKKCGPRLRQSPFARARCRSNKPEKHDLFAEQCARRNEAYFATALAMTNSRTAGSTGSGTSSFGALAPGCFDRAVIALTGRLPDNWLGLRLAIALRRLVTMRLAYPDGAVDVIRWGLRLRLHPRDNGCEKNLLFTPQMYEPTERAELAAA